MGLGEQSARPDPAHLVAGENWQSALWSPLTSGRNVALGMQRGGVVLSPSSALPGS